MLNTIFFHWAVKIYETSAKKLLLVPICENLIVQNLFLFFAYYLGEKFTGIAYCDFSDF